MSKMIIFALPLVILPCLLGSWAEGMQKELREHSTERMERIVNSAR